MKSFVLNRTYDTESFVGHCCLIKTQRKLVRPEAVADAMQNFAEMGRFSTAFNGDTFEGVGLMTCFCVCGLPVLLYLRVAVETFLDAALSWILAGGHFPDPFL